MTHQEFKTRLDALISEYALDKENSPTLGQFDLKDLHIEGVSGVGRFALGQIARFLKFKGLYISPADKAYFKSELECGGYEHLFRRISDNAKRYRKQE